MSIQIYGLQPVPCSRPRVTRYGTYYTAPTKKFKADLEELIVDKKSVVEGFNEDIAVHVNIDFEMVKARTSKLLFPKGDLDNYIKSIFDAITKAGFVWGDDKQVVSLTSTKKFSTSDLPIISVTISEVTL